MTAATAGFDMALPWDTGRADRKSLRGWLTGTLAIVLIAGLIMPWLPVPEVEREELEKLPPQLARIVLEKPKPVPPPPPPPPPKEVKEVPKPEPKPVEKVQPKETTPKPQPTVADAQEKAKVSGLLAFKDAFADMREAVNMDNLNDTGAIQRGAGEAASIDRSLLTSKRGKRSAGVNVSALSRDTGGVALSGRETTKVDAPPETKGTGGVRKPKVVDERSRSIEEIRRVFDSNKGAIFAIYNRALRKDPTLQGKVVLELVIDPNGRVIDCKVSATEITDQNVVDKIVNRVRMFDFGVRNVRRTTISYPVHFLPT